MVLQFVGEYVAAFLLKNPSSKMKGFFVRLLFYHDGNMGVKAKTGIKAKTWIKAKTCG